MMRRIADPVMQLYSAVFDAMPWLANAMLLHVLNAEAEPDQDDKSDEWQMIQSIDYIKLYTVYAFRSLERADELLRKRPHLKSEVDHDIPVLVAETSDPSMFQPQRLRLLAELYEDLNLLLNNLDPRLTIGSDFVP